MMKLNGYSLLLTVFVFLAAVTSVSAQTQDAELEKRVEALENYVQDFQPQLRKFTDEVTNSARGYSQGLESSLSNYYLKLQANVDARLDALNSRVVVLNTSGKSFQRIDTEAGVFLISVVKKEKLENGIRLTLDIGNINFADYKDYKLTLSWGKNWSGNPEDSRTAWRQSLKAAEFSFQGVLTKGVWNSVKVDLIPANPDEIEHIECEMEVSTVLLDHK